MSETIGVHTQVRMAEKGEWGGKRLTTVTKLI